MKTIPAMFGAIALLGATAAMAAEGLAPAGQAVAPKTAPPAAPLPAQPAKPAGPAQAPVTAPPATVVAPDLRQVGPPDLVVSDLFIASNEVRFKVRNIGLGEKSPGQIHYRLTVTTYAISPADQIVGTRQFTGIAAITSLSRLRPGQESGDDRVAGQRVGLSENMRLELCINPDGALAEASLANNCLTRTSRQVLPDLELVRGQFRLYAPRKEDPWYKKVGDFLWDVVTGFEFDPSGLGPQDHVQLVIRNNGGVPVTGFDVMVGLTHPGRDSRSFQRTFTQTLAPGETRTIAVYVHQDNKRWSATSCCEVVAMLDGAQRISESDEGNNKKALSTARVRDHR